MNESDIRPGGIIMVDRPADITSYNYGNTVLGVTVVIVRGATEIYRQSVADLDVPALIALVNRKRRVRKPRKPADEQ